MATAAAVVAVSASVMLLLLLHPEPSPHCPPLAHTLPICPLSLLLLALWLPPLPLSSPRPSPRPSRPALDPGIGGGAVEGPK